jgi:NAD(P)-dependent dehydrogenase (short-subunit alcohol dehydrogenase family)
MGQLRGKRCLIVGGTGGLGLAAATRFLGAGARVVVAGHDRDQGRAAAAVLADKGEAHFVRADATEPGEVSDLFAAATARLGGLDVLYHVAGGSGRGAGDGSLHACTDDGWSVTLRLNLTSTFLTNRAAVQHYLGGRQPGVILNMASVLAIAPSPHHFDTCAYAAAKGGIIALSRLAAARYAPDRIRVNVLAPGLIDTPMAARAVQDEAIRHFLCTKQPLTAGPGRPEDCSEAAVFLCSDAARFVTGVVLPIDGGWCVSEGQYEERMKDDG